MGWFTILFFALVIVGSSNAVNLTDGLTVWQSVAPSRSHFAYAFLSYAAGNFRVAEYLQVPFYPFTAELTVVCMRASALVSGFFGLIVTRRKFSWGHRLGCHRRAIGVVAICCKQELLLVVVGGVFVIEAVSVILQVLSFKLTGKRIFAMSPLHHHFELVG
jgi:phospho-N-acetylmuramoyl-pentapeptide-transferase